MRGIALKFGDFVREWCAPFFRILAHMPHHVRLHPLMQDHLIDPDEPREEGSFTWQGAIACILFGWLVKILRGRVREHMIKTGNLRRPQIYRRA